MTEHAKDNDGWIACDKEMLPDVTPLGQRDDQPKRCVLTERRNGVVELRGIEMRYFYDTEFIEDGKTIDLISIGVVAEDGRSYYAISTEFNAKKASQWVKDNVLSHLPPRNVNFSDLSIAPRIKDEAMAWRPRRQIANDLIAFFRNGPQPTQEKFELWGYYADYDHVALCQLYGTMMSLPEGWPMYTLDLKQWCHQLGNPKLPEQGKGEHQALADARWNKRVFEFLSAIGESK